MSLHLYLHYLDQSFLLNCENGSQTILWLVNTCRFRFKTDFPYETRVLMCEEVFDAQNKPLLPFYQVKEYCKDGDVIRIHFTVRNKVEINELSIWEAFARTDPTEYIPVLITFDVNNAQVSESASFATKNDPETPVIVGNFTGWRFGLEMKHPDAVLQSNNIPTKKMYSYSIKSIAPKLSHIVSKSLIPKKVEESIPDPRKNQDLASTRNTNPPQPLKISQNTSGILESSFKLVPVPEASDLESLKTVSAAVYIQKMWRGRRSRQHTFSSLMHVLVRDGVPQAEIDAVLGSLKNSNNSEASDSILHNKRNSVLHNASSRHTPVAKSVVSSVKTESVKNEVNHDVGEKIKSLLKLSSVTRSVKETNNFNYLNTSLESSTSKIVNFQKWQIVIKLPASCELLFCFIYRGKEYITRDYTCMEQPPAYFGRNQATNFLSLSTRDRNLDMLLQNISQQGSGLSIPTLPYLYLLSPIAVYPLIGSNLFRSISFPSLSNSSGAYIRDLCKFDLKQTHMDDILRNENVKQFESFLHDSYEYFYSILLFLTCLDPAMHVDSQFTSTQSYFKSNIPDTNISKSYAKNDVDNNGEFNFAISHYQCHWMWSHIYRAKSMRKEAEGLYAVTQNDVAESIFGWSKVKSSVVSVSKVKSLNERVAKQLFESFGSNYENIYIYPQISRLEMLRSFINVGIFIYPSLKPLNALMSFLGRDMNFSFSSFQYSYRTYLHQPYTFSVFEKYCINLRRIFVQYASTDSNGQLNLQSTISFSKFFTMVNDYQMNRVVLNVEETSNVWTNTEINALTFGVSIDFENDLWKKSLGLTWPEFLLSQATFALLAAKMTDDSESNRDRNFCFPSKSILMGLSDRVFSSFVESYFQTMNWPSLATEPKSTENVILPTSNSITPFSTTVQKKDRNMKNVSSLSHNATFQLEPSVVISSDPLINVIQSKFNQFPAVSSKFSGKTHNGKQFAPEQPLKLDIFNSQVSSLCVSLFGE